LQGNLDNRNNTLVLNASTGTWESENLTIRGGTLSLSGGATLDLRSDGTTTFDGGYVFGTILIPQYRRLQLRGDWWDLGTLYVTGGTLDVGGTFTTDRIGDVRYSNGSIRLTGTLNNQGTEFVVDTVRGNWVVDGGTINGGGVRTTGQGYVSC